MNRDEDPTTSANIPSDAPLLWARKRDDFRMGCPLRMARVDCRLLLFKERSTS
jgi:hypothetical protein